MAEITDEMIQEAIKKCSWRKGVHGVNICAGNCGVCSVEIERGRCDALRELFGKAREEGNKEGG